MARFTTVVTLIGHEVGGMATTVAHRATNVGAVLLGDFDAETRRDRIRAAWKAAQRRKAIYTLTDFDPMCEIVDAWVARLAGDGTRLPLEVGLADRIELPDYFMVAEDVEGETAHWYHGLIRGLAPRRVLTVPGSPDAIQRELERLRSDRPFPSADVVARRALDYSPTRLSGPASAEPEGFDGSLRT